MQDPSDLTFIAEACRDIEELKKLAKHHSALVREGAAYGLAALLGEARWALLGEARWALTELAKDTSKGVREAAQEGLE